MTNGSKIIAGLRDAVAHARGDVAAARVSTVNAMNKVAIAGATHTPLEINLDGEIFRPDDAGIFYVPEESVAELRRSHLYPLDEALAMRKKHAEDEARAQLTDLDDALERLSEMEGEIEDMRSTIRHQRARIATRWRQATK